MALEVNQLQTRPMVSSLAPAPLTRPRARRRTRGTYLCPCDIRRDEKLDVPMLEDPQHDLPQVPLVQVAPALEQLRRRVLLPLLVLGPRLAPVLARLVLLVLRLLLLLRPADGKQPGEDEYGLDVKFFERSQVGFDACREGEGKTAGCGEEGLPGGRVVNQRGEVVGRIDAQA